MSQPLPSSAKLRKTRIIDKQRLRNRLKDDFRRNLHGISEHEEFDIQSRRAIRLTEKGYPSSDPCYKWLLLL